MDEADKQYLEKMLETISENQRPDWIDIHNLKMIKYGSGFFIDCDLSAAVVLQHRTGTRSLRSAPPGDRKGIFRPDYASRTPRTPAKRSIARHCRAADCPYRRQPFTTPLVYTLNGSAQTDEQRNE
ncbi:MAG: hypothetical protein ACLR8Y_19855 [Alistipes indistinctus]